MVRSFGGQSVTVTGPSRPQVEVTDAEVAERLANYAFVFEQELPPLKPAELWASESTYKRRWRSKSDKAFEWLTPFVPLEIAKLPELREVQEDEPFQAWSIAVAIRRLIRARRKAKEPYEDLLRALYGACVAQDVMQSLEFEHFQAHRIWACVALDEVRAIRFDYRTLGYRKLPALGKTDVKWLIESFGEPVEHHDVNELWPDIRRHAIARFCRQELQRVNEQAKSFGVPEQSLKDWFEEFLRFNIGSEKERIAEAPAREAYLADLDAMREAAWAAARGPFVVADLETTGLEIETCEVLEFAAVRVAEDGTVEDEFSMLVQVGRVPPEIVELTGITQWVMDREGHTLPVAMNAFAAFVGELPLFFHNAKFDKAFLQKTSARTRVKLTNPVHDTLMMARQAWPSLGSYALEELAYELGIEPPTHRALNDAKATLAVLLAARSVMDERAAKKAARRG